MPTTDPTCVSRVCSIARAIPKSVSFTVISPVGGSCALAGALPREAGEKKVTIAQREVLKRKVEKIDTE